MKENLINNNALISMARKAAPQVLQAIKQASVKTGVNFAYLMEQAAAESSFNAQAEARTSSAAGLYQFIESTWLGMVKQHGHKYGLGDLADKIGDNFKVSDRATRQQILELRKDPEKAALLAAEFAADNQRYLERTVGGEIGSTELYFAHFMGPGGAAGFLKAMKNNPLQTAADLFPREARANRNVFYDRKTGEARTLAGVYDFFDKKFSGGKGLEDALDIGTAPAPKPAAKPARYIASTGTDDGLRLANPFRVQNSDEDNAWGWPSPTSALPGRTLVFNPADVMLLAQRELPTDHRGGNAHRYNQ